MTFLTFLVSTKKLALSLMELKRSIVAFLLLTLLALKVSAFHVYSHHSDDTTSEACEQCEHFFQGQPDEFTVVPFVEIPEKSTYTVPTLKETTFKVEAVRSMVLAHPHCRPPPAFLA